MDCLEKRTLHKLGRVKLVVKHIADYDADNSDLGVFSNYREPANKDEKLVHLDTDLVLDHKGIWRDQLGRIATMPEEYRHSREYQFTFHDNGHERIKYALQDSQRLREINNGYIQMFGIVAEVYLDGAEIGQASCWGFPSDDDCIRYEDRNIAREALSEARNWYTNNLAA